MEDKILCIVEIICLLIFLIYLLKTIQTIWLRYIENRDKKRIDKRGFAEAVNIHKRKIAIMRVQEVIRERERKHELAIKPSK